VKSSCFFDRRAFGSPLEHLFCTNGRQGDAGPHCGKRQREGRDAIEDGLEEGEESIADRKERLEARAKELVDRIRNLTRKERDIILAAIEAGQEKLQRGKRNFYKALIHISYGNR